MQAFAMEHPIMTFFMFLTAVWGVVAIANLIRLGKPQKKD